MDDGRTHKGVIKSPPRRENGDKDTKTQLALLFHESNLAKVIGVAESLLKNNVSEKSSITIAEPLIVSFQGSSHQIS